MPTTYNQVSVEHLQTQADSLLRAGTRLATAAKQMKEAGLTEAWIVWSNSADEMVSLLAGVTTTTTGLIEEQVSDHKAGKTPRFVAVKKRTERLKNKAAAAKVAPHRKKRGA